jgi:hypothetical protein
LGPCGEVSVGFDSGNAGGHEPLDGALQLARTDR